MFNSTTFIIIGIPVICGTLIALAAILKGGGRKETSRQKEDEEEARLIHELHQSLSKMETRIEALETILIKKDDRKDNFS